MADDLYGDFAALAAAETEYHIVERCGTSDVAVIAPHGGGIEGGTTELADAVAGTEHRYYSFQGLKSSGNATLHITSHRFDEPRCLALLATATQVVALHGVGEGEPGVYVGGLDEDLGKRIADALEAAGFTAGPPPGHLAGRSATNICNRGASGAGVQLELTRALRKTMFQGLGASGRRTTTEVFDRFVASLRGVLAR